MGRWLGEWNHSKGFYKDGDDSTSSQFEAIFLFPSLGDGILILLKSRRKGFITNVVS